MDEESLRFTALDERVKVLEWVLSDVNKNLDEE